MSSKKNIIKTGLSSAGLKCVRVIEQLFLIPFFITHWGTNYYGEWLTLTIIPSVLGFSDLGFGTAAANSFVLKYVSGKLNDAADILKTGFIVISMVVFGGIIIVGLGVSLATHFDWLKNSLIPAKDASQALIFMLLSRFLSFYTQLFEAIFRGVRKAYIGINLQTIFGCMNVGAGLIALFLGYGVVGFALGQLLTAIICNSFYCFFSLRSIPDINLLKAKFQKSIFKEIFGLGLGYLMSPIWQSILFQGTTFVVRITLGPTAVAMFNTVRTVSRSVNQVYSIINMSIFPEIQFEIGAGHIAKAKALLKKAMKVTGLIAILGLLAMLSVGLPLYNWWTKNELNPPYMLWLFLVLSTAVNALWWTSAVVFSAKNKPYRLSTAGVIFSIFSIGITYICCHYFGIVGAAIGGLAFEIGMALYIIPVSFKLINSK